MRSQRQGIITKESPPPHPPVLTFPQSCGSLFLNKLLCIAQDNPHWVTLCQRRPQQLQRAVVDKPLNSLFSFGERSWLPSLLVWALNSRLLGSKLGYPRVSARRHNAGLK